MSLLVGVLGVQGDVREHVAALRQLGVETLVVRRTEELDQVSGLVFPGGESSTMDKLVRAFGLFEPLRARLTQGMPAYGSCAGMIMLADRILDGAPGQQTLGGLDVTVRRNAFGRQVDSYEAPLHVDGVRDPDRPMHAVFIRAPWIEQVGNDVTVLARVEAREAGHVSGMAHGSDGDDHPPVVVRQGNLLASSFHPEVTDDLRLHEVFVSMCEEELSSTTRRHRERAL